MKWSLSCKWISPSLLKSGSQSDWDVVKCNCKCSRGLRADDDESVLGGNVIKIMVLKPYLWLAFHRINLVVCWLTETLKCRLVVISAIIYELQRIFSKPCKLIMWDGCCSGNAVLLFNYKEEERRWIELS